MAKDSKHDQPTPDDQVDETVDDTVEAKLANLDEMKAELEKLESELAGAHRRNSTLENRLKKRDTEIDDMRKAQMDADERFKFELDKREHELAAREHELKTRENKERATKFLSENALPQGIAEILPLDDWETTAAKLETLKSVVETDRASVLEAYKTKGGARPTPGGLPPKPGLKKSDMTVDEATAFAKEHGTEAFLALPD